MNGLSNHRRLSATHSAVFRETLFAERGVTASTLDDASSFTLNSTTNKNEKVSHSPGHTPSITFQPPTLVHAGRAESRTPVPKRNLVPPTLLSEVLNNPFFQLLPSIANPTDTSTVTTLRAHEGSLLNSPVLSSNRDTATPPFPSQAVTSSGAVAAGAAPAMTDLSSGMRADQQDVSISLPTSHVPPPSMLLMALADMDVLQQSFYAHTCIWPAKGQVEEFKKLVAASMRAELSRGVTGAATTTVTKTVTADKESGARSNINVSSTTPAPAGAQQAHDAAVRAALHSAHGFLCGTDLVPTGVPKAHLQRARLTWVRQYGSTHVQPRLEQAQRYRYEVWRLQGQTNKRQQRMQQQTRGPEDVPRVQRGVSISSLDPTASPAAMCAALKPRYWQTGTVDIPADTEVTSTAAAAAMTKNRSALLDAAQRRHGFLPASTLSVAAAEATAMVVEPEEAEAVAAVWDIDLFDDLQLVMTAQLIQSSADQAITRGAVESSDLYYTNKTGGRGGPAVNSPSPSSPANAFALLGAVADRTAAAAGLLHRPADLTQMQLPLPVFVYVMSRYLFLAHYAVHFPPGLFSSALINPFYLPDPEQCTASYSLRAVPGLRREADVVRAGYAAQLADMHNCFPEQIPYMEVPLPRHDVIHLYELLCPPQRQDRVGRWQPVQWGQLLPEEEEALLQAEYANNVASLSGGERSRAAHNRGTPCATTPTGGREQPLLGFAYARTARRLYRHRLQQLAQHPLLIAEVRRLLTVCEEVAMRFFSTVDTEQRGCITWEALTTALIEEADVRDHQLKVREHAALLTRASASVFDRYVVEPLAPAMVRLGYTGTVFEVRHSASLVMLEGATDYALCDSTQLGSIHQRFLVRPIDVVLKELEAVPRDAFGRPLRSAGIFTNNSDDDGGRKAGGGGAAGYDAALRLHPWRHNQQPVCLFVRYEDGRRLQESTALSVLQQLTGAGTDDAGGSGFSFVGGGDDVDGSAGGRRGSMKDGAVTLTRTHQLAKPVSLQAAMAVEDVSPYVPWTVFVVLGNDMLLRLYSSNRAVQALPEAGLLRCAETVTCMEWAAGGSHERVTLLEKDNAYGATAAERQMGDGPVTRMPTSTAASAATRPPPPLSRLSIVRQEYLILGTRSGVLCLVDLYAVLHKVPRLTTALASNMTGIGSKHDSGSDGTNNNNNRHHTQAEGRPTGTTRSVGGGGAGKSTCERIGSSSNAWSGYRALAQRTYYNDIDPFVLHRRQVHSPGTVVSSVIAAATNGLFVSSGLDGDVFTMRLGYPADATLGCSGGGVRRSPANAARAELTTVHSDGTMTTKTERPLLCIEVLHRLTVSETGVRHALPIPSLSMLAVQTVSNKVYLYHTSVLPTAAPLVDEGRGQQDRALPVRVGEMSSSTTAAAVAAATTAASNAASTAARLELYDAASPHLGVMVAVIAVEELDQLLTVDSTGYVKVWSLRQTQPLTSFYAVAPIQAANTCDTFAGQSTAAGGRGDGDGGMRGMNAAPGRSPSTSQGSSSGGNLHDSGGAEGKGLVSSLLRTTKHSIEAAVEAADSRLQPCLSAAYNYAGRQLYVMGSNNAALCFFMSGQSSARAHTNPLRALLIPTTANALGQQHQQQLHRRLITLSSADCRVWSLMTGAMELGIRASNTEYRQLFDHRLTGRPKSTSRGNSTGGSHSNNNDDSGSGGGSSTARGRPSKTTRDVPATMATLAAFASTTGEASRLLPRSVEDVMRAVSAHPGTARSRARHLRAYTSASATHTAGGTSSHVGTISPKTMKSNTQKTATAPAGASRNITFTTTAATTTSGAAGESDDVDLLLPGVLRDHNVITSDIRCACLGPEGQWVGYALLHGEIRLHRSDSGRLLHTFITTPPSMMELVQAALHYEHLFMLSSATVTSSAASAALALSFSTLGTAQQGTPSPDSVHMPWRAGTTGVLRGTTAAGTAEATPTTPSRTQHVPPKTKITPTVYAQAVAVVLQRLLASVKVGQRFGSISASTAGSAAAGLIASSGRAGSNGAAGDALDSVSRDVHREPLNMFYVEAAQELFVVYADGLVRVFTLLGHRTTATRVIVSRTLVNRALEQVRKVLSKHVSSTLQQQQRLNLYTLTNPTATLVETRAKTGTTASQPQSSSPQTSVPLRELLKVDAALLRGQDNNDTSLQLQQVNKSAEASLFPQRRCASSLLADVSSNVTGTAFNTCTLATSTPRASNAHPDFSTTHSAFSANSDTTLMSLESPQKQHHQQQLPQQLEPDVVLLATASPPLGLICLVHASGLVTVMDVQATSSNVLAGLGSQSADVGAGFGAPFLENAPAGSVGGTGGSLDDFSRSQPGVVVHSFMTTDEVTAAAFLGAYPCLVLADRQRVLSFHLVKGASMLALLDDFAERLQRDAAELLGKVADKPISVNTTANIKSPSSSSTLIWTTSIDDTCASVHVLGSVTVLTFDPLYATLYVGTSQGYIMSYLLRRLLLAFQLTPVFLRGVDGVAITTYAAELQRSGARRAVGISSTPSDQDGKGRQCHVLNFLSNLLHVLFGITPSCVRGPSVEEAARTQDPHSSALLRFYEDNQELFRSSRSGAGATLLSALLRSPSSLFVAAAVVHDAVTRMCAAATVQLEGGGNNATASSNGGTSLKVQSIQPWWNTTIGGGAVKEYVAQQCGAAGEFAARGDGPAFLSNEDSTNSNNSRAAADVQVVLPCATIDIDEDGAQLLREWVALALADAPPHTSDDADCVDAAMTNSLYDDFLSGAVTPVLVHRQSRVSSLENSSASDTLPPLSASSSPTRCRLEHSIPTKNTNNTVTMSAAPRTRKCTTPPPPAPTPRAIADALVREVEVELLYGGTAAAVHDHRASPAFATQQVNSVGHNPHPVTRTWVEPLFTRHAVAMASRSPLCLLTPPAMLERSRRERLDRQARHATTTTAAAATAAQTGALVEWDHYVEGAPPDYLVDMLNRPGQVLPEAERQALRQRAITAMQCRRNGYLCVGHADGGVTLWTPYACGRLESLCPSTSLPASLERLSQSVKLQFQYVHERVLLERQRLAFEGAVHNVSRNEQDGKVHMKQRIRKLLLDHHLSQLHHNTEAAHVNGSTTNLSEVRAVPPTNTQPPAGALEAELLAMRPLLCLLLGIATPAELHARQLALEDLFFLPLRMDSIAALEAFKAECYTAAVEVAVRRLWRELMEVDDVTTPTSTAAGAAGRMRTDADRHFTRYSMDDQEMPYSTGLPRLPRTLSLTPAPAQRESINYGVRCVYDYPLSFLTRLLHLPFHPCFSSGLTTYPGVVRLLLHRSLEGAPHGHVGERPTLVSLAHQQITGFSGAAVNATPARGPSVVASDANTNARATTVTAAGSAEGSYFEVCHALQLAEVYAEAQWEASELDRMWTQLQRSEGTLPPRTNDLKWRKRLFSDDDNDTGEGASLPPRSAAAVSAAVHQKLLRELEDRLSALSQRAPAAAALRRVRLQFSPGASADSGQAGSLGGGGAVYGGRLTRGTGMAWVQATLQQQSCFAFAEPQLKLPMLSDPSKQPTTTVEVAATTRTSATKLRATAAVQDARRCPPLSPASTDDHAVLSPIPLGSTALASQVPPVGLPTIPVTQRSPLHLVEATGTFGDTDTKKMKDEGDEHGQQNNVSSDLATPLDVDAEAQLLNKSSTVPAVFLTEMNATSLAAGATETREAGVHTNEAVRHSPWREDNTKEAGNQRYTRPAPINFKGANATQFATNVAAAVAAAVTLSPPPSRLTSVVPPCLLTSVPPKHGLRSLSLAPLHHTKLARTGSSQLARPRPVDVANTGAYRTWRAPSMGYAADIATTMTAAAGADDRSASPRLRASASCEKHAKCRPSSSTPCTCYSLLERCGTTK